MTTLPASLNSSDLASIKGSTQARIYTAPLRELSEETSYGFKVITFADKILHQPLDEWQKWLVIHLGELNPDGTPRFRKVLVLVPRQNGKTHLLKVLALYWQFIERHKLILGMNASLSFAKDAMKAAADDARANPILAPLVDRVLEGNNDIHMRSTDGCVYKAVAATRKGGRGKSTDRAIIDELREQRSWEAYNAVIPSMGARADAQAIFITNQGDDTSVVLDSLRAAAMDYIETGTGDDDLGLFEWSAPDNAEIYDPQAWAVANPSLNIRLPYKTLKSAALLASAGGQEETGFKTEHLCMKVRALDAAVDPGRWNECVDVSGTLAQLKSATAFCLDVSFDQSHATLVAAAALPDGRIRIEVVRQWHQDALRSLARDIKTILAKHQPRVFGRFPIGPIATHNAWLSMLRVPGVQVKEITGEVTDACMGFADEVRVGRIAHDNDSLLTTHVTGAAKLWNGDRWKFTRRGVGNCDAAYAAAGAVQLVRTMPEPLDDEIYSIKPQERGK